MIKNLIIDFGNVIYKVDLLAAHRKFYEIAKISCINPNFQKINEIIDLYECGKLKTYEFRDNIKNLLKWNTTDKDFDNVWNSILLGPFEFAEYSIANLAKKYNLFLLSNTSPLHYNKFKYEVDSIFKYFKELFFSFEIGYKKPHAQIFKYAISRSNIIPQETLFLDDIQENIDKFRLLGVQGVLIHEKFTLKDFALNYL